MKEKYRSANLDVIIYLIVLLLIITFSDKDIEVDVNSNEVSFVETKWWGLSVKETEIRWIESYESWCARDKNGKWYPFLSEPPEGPDIDYDY